MRHTKELRPKQKETLKLLIKNSDIFRVRTRAQAIILSSNKYSVEEISKFYEVDRDSVSSWIDKWEKNGVDGLYDGKKSGRPSKIFPDLKKRLNL